MGKNTFYDKTMEFSREIAPLMTEVSDLCDKNNIVYFAVFGVKQNSDTSISKRNSDDPTVKSVKSNIIEEDHVYRLIPGAFNEDSDYDKSSKYEKEIAPLMTQIEAQCLKNKIPFFATFAVKKAADDSKKSKAGIYKTNETYCLLPVLFEDIHTSDKTFGRLVNVMNGFKTYRRNNASDFNEAETEKTAVTNDDYLSVDNAKGSITGLFENIVNVMNGFETYKSNEAAEFTDIDTSDLII